MGKNCDYVVCSSYGDASWQYAYRAWKAPQCKFCRSKWSEWTMKGYRLSDDNTTVYSNAWQPWTSESKKVRPPKAQAVLTEVWELLPQQAKELIGEAGWKPPQPTVPPGFRARALRPKGQLKSQELVKSSWKSAEAGQKKVLQKLGLAFSVSFRRSLVTPRGLQRLTLSTVTVPTHSGHSHFSRHCSSESVWLEPRAGRGLRLPKLSSLDFKHLKLREHKTAFGLQLSKH